LALAGGLVTIKVRKFWSSTPSRQAPAGEGLDAFSSEGEALPEFPRPVARVEPQAAPGKSGRPRWVPILLGLLSVSLVGAAAWSLPLATAFSSATGSLTLVSFPAGAEVLVAGEPRGYAPVTVDLPAGSHEVRLRTATAARTLTVEVAAGNQAVHHVDMAGAGTLPGTLRVSTEPEGLPVTVDGIERGAAPIELKDLPPGLREIQIVAGGTTLRRTVPVEAGIATAVLMVVPPASAPAVAAVPSERPTSGWVSVSAGFPIDILAGSRKLIPSNGRIALPAGRHDLDLVSDELGYRARRSVVVPAGAVATLQVDTPTALLSVNALPWADVIIDGKAVGQTPLANVPVPIGSHEVVFRHPAYGEQRQTVLVSLKQPARVSVNMQAK
jgi:hypothetical protein